MNGNARRAGDKTLIGGKPPLWYYFCCFIFTIAVVVFYIIRLPELLSLININPMAQIIFLGTLGSLVSFFVSPSRTVGVTIRRVGICAILVIQMKKDLDEGVKSNTVIRDLTDNVCIVTGANSGVGFAVSQTLFNLNCNVVMACRNIDKCKHAKDTIIKKYIDIHTQMTQKNVSISFDPIYYKPRSTETTNYEKRITTMVLDLSDLNSVKTFTDEFKWKYKSLDILINNAGAYPSKGEQTKQGLEMAFGTMHIGHFALTKWLMPKLLLKTKSNRLEAARIVNVGSQAWVAGYFHSSLFYNDDGMGDLSNEMTDNCGAYKLCCPLGKCPFTNGYGRAKLSNMLHMFSVQYSTDVKSFNRINSHRRIVTSSLHPGEVTTNILGEGTLNIFSLFLRSIDQSAYVILHAIMSDSYVPSSYIDGMKVPHDIFEYSNNYLKKYHFRAFPYTESKKFALDMNKMIKKFKFDDWMFRDRQLISYYNDSNINTTTPFYSSIEIAERLERVSDNIINKFLWNKKAFKMPKV